MFWLEIATSYFEKPILTFREGQVIKDSDRNANVIEVVDSCPACGYKLSNQQEACPDCGLNFV